MLKNTKDTVFFPIILKLYVKEHRNYNLFHIIFPPILQSFLWQLYDKVVRY